MQSLFTSNSFKNFTLLFYINCEWFKEIVINARFTEKYGEDFNITLPDEHHIKCGKYDTKYTSENAMDKGFYLF